MATAQEKFKKQNEQVANHRRGIKEPDVTPKLEINTEKGGQLWAPTKVESVDSTTEVTVLQPGEKGEQIAISSQNAIAHDLTPMYKGATDLLKTGVDSATATFAEVAGTLTTLLSNKVTVDQMATTIGKLSWEQRGAQLKVLDEIENAQVVELKKLEIKDTQVDIELKRLALQVKVAKGYLKNAIAVEEVVDLQNQLTTVQKANQLKQDGRNIELNFMAGANAIAQNRVTGKLNYLQGRNQRHAGRESDRLGHMDNMTALHNRLYRATEKGYAAYVETKEAGAEAKASRAQRLKAEVKSNG